MAQLCSMLRNQRAFSSFHRRTLSPSFVFRGSPSSFRFVMSRLSLLYRTLELRGGVGGVGGGPCLRIFTASWMQAYGVHSHPRTGKRAYDNPPSLVVDRRHYADGGGLPNTPSANAQRPFLSYPRTNCSAKGSSKFACMTTFPLNITDAKSVWGNALTSIFTAFSSFLVFSNAACSSSLSPLEDMGGKPRSVVSRL